MGLAGLNSALAGLRVSQQQISVISNNVSNVGTPGYSRKIMPQSTLAVGGTTYGVRAETIIRNVDLNLERDLWTQVSAVGKFSVQETYLNRVQQFHGPPDQELSVAAEISRLRDSFSALADSPEDSFLQSSAIRQAEEAADKVNDLSKLITTLRNDAQSEMKETISRINELLVQIADTNKQVRDMQNLGRSSAFAQDQRDIAIKELSGLIEVSFFQRGDGVLVVQTNRGQELASERANTLNFSANPLSPATYYPLGIEGVYVGNPAISTAVDITEDDLGGKLGGLIELRDVTFPKQMAQLDEMAHKMATRMAAQGLRLFTDTTGSIPLDTAPDPTTNPPTAVPYVGFSAVIRVNQNIINDHSLIRTGTYGATVNTGSNEVIRRVLEFGFSDVNYQQAENLNAATQVDLLNRGGDDLQSWLGLYSSNTYVGARDLSPFASIADLVTSANGALDDPNDQFQITFSEPRTGLGPTSITVDLSVADTFPGADAITQLVNHINNAITAAGVPAGLAASASVGANGELVINTRGAYEIDSTFAATGMGEDGLVFLGIVDNAGAAVAPQDAYFDVQVGNASPVRIFLEPGDSEVELIAKLQAVEGLAVDTTNFALDGLLRLRPGNDFDTPNFGGDLRITGGPFDTNGATYGTPPALTARTAIDNGVNIAAALFGTYTAAAGVVTENPPTRNVNYGSETNGSLTAPIPTQSFRDTLLGPAANISSRVVGSLSLIDFAQRMVNEHSQNFNANASYLEDETSLQDILQTQFLDESGVNLDEELGNLIVVQTAYSASARVLSAVDDLFRELLNSIR